MAPPRPAWMNSWSAAGVCLLIAAAAGWVTFDDLASHRRLAEDGQPATVQVLDRAREDRRRGGSRYWLRVRVQPPWAVNPPPFDSEYAFATDMPAPGERDVEVVWWEYDTAKPGSRLKVLYLPDATDQPIASSTLSGWQPPIVGFALIGTFLFAALTLARDGWRNRKQPRSA